MRLSPRALAAINTAHPVEDLIEARVKLGRPNARGIRAGQCLCQPVRGKSPLWVNRNNPTFGCLRGGGCGGDVFGYLKQFEGLDFASAIERLGGQAVAAKPRAIDPQEEREHKRLEREKREKERGQAFAIWARARPTPGTPVDAYFLHRGLAPLATRAIRFARTEPYFSHHGPDDAPTVLWTGPAMVAAIVGPDRHFLGVHRTWLDPRLASGELPEGASGKTEIIGPDGDVLPSKKMRGNKRGGAIRLNDPRYDCRKSSS